MMIDINEALFVKTYKFLYLILLPEKPLLAELLACMTNNHGVAGLIPGTFTILKVD